MDGRPGTAVVAGALKVFAVLVAAGAVIGVALFRAELLKLVPFVGATGPIAPAIFAALVIGVALLFWALSDVLRFLAAAADADARIEAELAKIPKRAAPQPAPGPKPDPAAAANDVPGYKRYQQAAPRELKWAATVTNGPGMRAAPVCEVEVGDTVSALGEVASFAFVEARGGYGWVPKDALTSASGAA